MGTTLNMKLDPEEMPAPPASYDSKALADKISADYDLDEDVRSSDKSIKLAESKFGYNSTDYRYESVEECDWESKASDDFFESKSKKNCKTVLKKVLVNDWFKNLASDAHGSDTYAKWLE